jgi:hypothetical protein
MNFSPKDAAEKIGNLAKSDITGNDSPVTFMIDKDLYGAVPEPYPASSDLPDWYKDIPMFATDEHGRDDKRHYSIRGCKPFMQSLSLGWMLPLPSDLHIVKDQDGARLHFADIGSTSMVSTQDRSMYGEEYNMPIDGGVSVKFKTPWYISVPENYSLFNLPILNRWESDIYKYFYPFSGIWEADKVVTSVNQFAIMNLPEKINTIIPAGTPIAQIAAVHRDAFLYNATTRSLSEEEHSIIEKSEILRGISSHIYSNHLWEPMKSSRMVQNDNERAGGCPFSHNKPSDE